MIIMSVPILSREMCDNPATFEYFIRFIIIGKENEKNYKFSLKNKDNIFEDFCGKVLKGETLVQAVRRELLNSFGVKELESMMVYGGKQESAFNRFGEELPRMVLEVSLNKNQVQINSFKGSSVYWKEILNTEIKKKEDGLQNTEINKKENSLQKRNLNEEERDLLLKEVKIAGAKDVLTSTVDIKMFDAKMGMTTFSIPNENRIEIMKIIEEWTKNKNCKFTYIPKESPSTVMFMWA